MEPEEFESLQNNLQSPPAEPVLTEVESVVVEEVKEPETAAEFLKEIGTILAEHGGLESNIPLNSEYWDLTAKFRMLGK